MPDLAPGSPPGPGPGQGPRGDRLWAPWRMAYVGRDEADPGGCVFCDRLEGDDDVASLILLRLDHVFLIMNRYPYATGHLMVIPYHHGAAIEDAPPETMAAMAATLPLITRAARRALACTGFNIGMNVGAVAGAGIADHLHLHVVPRWPGDVNFMPIIGQTAVLPEALPATYAKLRLEIAREVRLTDATARVTDTASQPGPEHSSGVTGAVPLLVLTPDGTHLWLDDDASGPRLPLVTPAHDEAIWHAAARAVAPLGRATVTGLAGPPATLARATPATGPLALALRLEDPPGDADRHRFVPLAEARRRIPTVARWPALGDDPGSITVPVEG